MNLRQMEVFRAVMLTGSITGAADLLHVSAPAVSRLIKYLQVAVGVPLFERCRGRVFPTEDARILYSEIQKMYSGVEIIQQVARSLRTGAGRRLHIACSPSVGMAIAPKAVAQLRSRRPRLHVLLDVLPLPVLTEMLVKQRIEIGVAMMEPDHPSLQTLRVGHSDVVVALPAGNALTNHSRLSLRQLSGTPLIRFDTETNQGRTIDALLKQAGVDAPAEITVRIARVALAMVEAGAGVAIVDSLSAMAFNSKLVVVRPLRTKFSYPIHLVWNKDRPLSGVALEFAEFVREILKQDEYSGNGGRRPLAT